MDIGRVVDKPPLAAVAAARAPGWGPRTAPAELYDFRFKFRTNWLL